MFEHLDDPSSPDGSGHYDSVVARARRRIVMRRSLAGAASALCVVAIAILVANLLPTQHDPNSLYVGGTSPTPTQSVVSPSPTPSHKSPSPKPKQTHRTNPGNPGVTARPSLSCAPQNCPDGKPGWSDGTGADCFMATFPDSSAPDPALTFTLTLSQTTVSTGNEIGGTGTVTNTGASPLTFETVRSTEEEAVVLASDSEILSGLHHTAPDVQIESHTLQPSESFEFAVAVGIDSCGDTSQSGDQPLTPGSYRIAAFVDWRTDQGSSLARWQSAPVDITVT
ncbi:MAG: hypothetical protein QOG53_1774 [Frankiales bacterium]|jgi:hypothetical protein|nr:hypothetical protein [Frankiales bacterium]